MPWSLFVGGKAMCSDGVVRTLKRIAQTADTFFSIPASVEVRDRGIKKTVSGYVTIECRSGSSVPIGLDQPMVKFIAVQYGKNHAMLPKGAIKLGVDA